MDLVEVSCASPTPYRVLLHGRSTDGRFIQGPFGPIRAHMGPYGARPGPTHHTKPIQKLTFFFEKKWCDFLDFTALQGPGPGPYGPIRAHMGPYGPLWAHIWAHMRPYGPIYGPLCALMGPPGQVLEDSVNFP